MKTKLLFFLPALLIALTAFIKFDTGHYTAPPPVVSLNNSFIFGAINDEWDYGSGYSHADQIGVNVSHRYTGEEEITYNGILRIVPTGRTSNDRLLSDVGDYEDEVTDYLKDLYDNHNGRRSITQRPKIVWLCYGQSSTYEAEPIPTSDDLWFYSFNEHNTGTDVTDNGKTVMYCELGTDSPGYVVSRLKANTEQSKPSNGYEGDIKCEWYVKPRIRIPAAFVQNNPESDICKIHIIEEDGTTDKIPPVVIKAKNFRRNITTPYQGEYLEEFFFLENNDPFPVTFTGSLGSDWWFHARGTRTNDNGLINKADIKVEWLGNCDMWLDYVKVENDIADQLFKGDHDDWIKDEIEQIAFDGNPGSVPPMGGVARRAGVGCKVYAITLSSLVHNLRPVPQNAVIGNVTPFPNFRRRGHATSH